MDKQFTFSANCVIDLNSFGEFKDYGPIVDDLIEDINKNNKINIEMLDEILQAQFQDIQHIPNFRQLVSLLFQHSLEELSVKSKRKFIILLLKLMQTYFTTFFGGEEFMLLAEKIIKYLTGQIVNFMEEAMDFFLYMSAFVSYAENHNQLVSLFKNSIFEEKIFTSEKLTEQYMKTVEKFLRNVKLRKIFKESSDQKMEQNQPYLAFKLLLWEGDQKKITHQLEIVQKKYKSVQFDLLRCSLGNWRKRIQKK